MKVDDVASKMNVLPSSLSRSFGNEVLTAKAKRQAAQILGVDESVFEHGIGYESLDVEQGRVEEPGEVERLREEVERMREEVAKVTDELLRERALNDTMQAALRVLAGKDHK